MALSTVENNTTDDLIKKLTMLELLNHDRKSDKKYCDARLKAETEEFSVHRVVLGLRSPYFDNLLRSDMSEKYAEVINVNLSDEKLKMILDYIYTDVANISTENALDLLEVAEYTQTEFLKWECSKFILKMVDVDNCIKLFAYAQRYNLPKLVDTVTQIMADNLAIIVQQEDFVHLEVDTLTAISEQGRIKIQGESLFTGIVRWVNFKPGSRKQLFVKFFSQMDLSTVSCQFLDSTIVTENLVRESKICCLAVLDTMKNILQKEKVKSQEEASVLNAEDNESEKQCIQPGTSTKQDANLPVTSDNPSTSKVTVESSESTNVPSMFKDFVCVVQNIPDEDCGICKTKLCKGSVLDEEDPSACQVLQVLECHHRFHNSCLKYFFNSDTSTGVACPNCETPRESKIGNQPPGQMTDRIIEPGLPGYHCSTIEITYNIKSGIQGTKHPNPDQPYHAYGFPRVAYLPNNVEGQKVLRMLKVAWRRGVVFSVGRSLTSGQDNAVTWAGIRHKTSMGGGTHGFPDSTFFENVIYELQAHGITEEDI